MSLVLSKMELNFYKRKFMFFKNKFSLIKDIELNDKIGIINNEIYLDKYQWCRYIKRRFYNQSYIKINIFLKKEFNSFVKFLDQYMEIVNLMQKKNILTNKIYYFIEKLITGLYNLKKSYQQRNVLINTINGIILILYEFNESIATKLIIKCRKNSI